MKTKRNWSKWLMTLLVLLAGPLSAMAEEAEESAVVEMLYASGKIYTVTAVISIILLGIFVFMFMVDRKVSRMEKKLESSEK